MILKLLSEIYKFFINRHNNRYDNNLAKTYRATLPVISIGNLSVGGSGKTPFTIMLAKELITMGKKPAIIGYGYKKKTKGEVIVSNAKELLVDSEGGGDEMVLLAKRLPNVPIIANSKKYLSALTIHEKFDVDCIIIDDGFQHRKLLRDFDILLIDDKTINNPNLLPLGLLREPFTGVKRASVIALNQSVNAKEIQNHLMPHQLIIQTKVSIDTPYNLINNQALRQEDMLRLKHSAIAVSGIANPHRFLHTLEEFGINILKHYSFPDHYNYCSKSIHRILDDKSFSKSSFIITTEKDAVKLADFSALFQEKQITCAVLPISTQIILNKKQFLDSLSDILVKFK